MTAIVTSVLAMMLSQPVPHTKPVPPVWRATIVVTRAERHRRHMRRVVRPYNAKLERMAWCESTGRWYIATGNGFYGGLQFTLRSWWAVGGTGYPHNATKLEQKYRAIKLMRLQGWGAWPVCQYA
jgi:hypothetical protein